MNDEVEQRMEGLTPRGVRPELRRQVLAAVDAELQGNHDTTGTGVPLLGTSSAVSALRGQHCMLQAVAHANEKCEPSAKPDSPWLYRATIAVAASLLFGISLNLWASAASQSRLAQLFGPPPISKRAMQLANDVGRITDAKTGQWVYRHLTVPRLPSDGAAAYEQYGDAVKRLIDELQTVSKDSYYETPQKDPQMDRGHSGCIPGNRFDCQRRVRLDHRCTA